MTLDFNAVDPTVVPHFKGGTGEAHVRTAVADGMGRILTLTLPARSSIGLHSGKNYERQPYPYRIFLPYQ